MFLELPLEIRWRVFNEHGHGYTRLIHHIVCPPFLSHLGAGLEESYSCVVGNCRLAGAVGVGGYLIEVQEAF